MKDKARVMKFGGTSVGNAECIGRVAEIVAAASREGAPVVAVVSAMGGVTNRLIEAARAAEKGDAGAGAELAGALRRQHAEAVEALVKDGEGRARLSERADDPAAVLYRVQESINTYFRGRTFEVTVIAGCTELLRMKLAGHPVHEELAEIGGAVGERNPLGFDQRMQRRR